MKLTQIRMDHPLHLELVEHSGLGLKSALILKVNTEMRTRLSLQLYTQLELPISSSSYQLLNTLIHKL